MANHITGRRRGRPRIYDERPALVRLYPDQRAALEAMSQATGLCLAEVHRFVFDVGHQAIVNQLRAKESDALQQAS